MRIRNFVFDTEVEMLSRQSNTAREVRTTGHGWNTNLEAVLDTSCLPLPFSLPFPALLGARTALGRLHQPTPLTSGSRLYLADGEPSRHLEEEKNKVKVYIPPALSCWLTWGWP